MDALGCGDGVLTGEYRLLRRSCENTLQGLMKDSGTVDHEDMHEETKFGFPPFFIDRGEWVWLVGGCVYVEQC